MKVLVVGSGGREHALAWKIARSPRVTKVFAAPGNAGIAQQAECVDIPATDTGGLLRFATDNAIDLTVVGPEAPLAEGLVDAFHKAKAPVFGPTARAAEIESSKVFAKNLMHQNAIPTASYRVFNDFRLLENHLEQAEMPVVLKADGLAAGKGVIVCRNRESALAAARLMMEKKAFGRAGNLVVVEECLEGREASILALVSGDAIVVLEPARDHKRAFDNDEGPNTGGMGAYSPVPFIDEQMMRKIERDVIIPTVHGMTREDRPYTGVLYMGLMITAEGPKVLEYNCRFGDPETQPLVMRLDTDLVDLIESALMGNLLDAALQWKEGASMCVVLASGGYPKEYEKGKKITGLDAADEMDDVVVFHSGTRRENGDWLTNGGRVLGVTALGRDIDSARDRAYEAVGKIHFEGMHFRKDIGAKK